MLHQYAAVNFPVVSRRSSY